MPCPDCERLKLALQREQAIARHWERNAKSLRRQLNCIRQDKSVETDTIELPARIHG
jgi:hypothetical protein